jgi:hypothetical protein
MVDKGRFRPRTNRLPFSLRECKAPGFATPHNLKLNDKSGDTLVSATRIEYQRGSCVEHSSTGNGIDMLIGLIPIHYLHNTTCGKSKMNDYRMKKLNLCSQGNHGRMNLLSPIQNSLEDFYGGKI